MYACTYVCMSYVCVYVGMYVCVYVYTYVCMYTYVHTYCVLIKPPMPHIASSPL